MKIPFLAFEIASTRSGLFKSSEPQLVANVLRQIANQRTVPQILEAYSYLEAADIDACLGYTALR